MRIPFATAFRSLRAARAARLLLAGALVATGGACTSRQTDGTSSAYLIVDQLLAAAGATPDKFGGTLQSDVRTEGGVFADFGQVTLRTAMKDPGSDDNPTVPSTTNWITITRYHVKFVRADGRNVQGVDVPYEFDGGMTVTALPAGSIQTFTLVRDQAKLEAPLMALATGFGDISTIAEVTFYGTDQAGRGVSALARISVNFANWADPK